MVEFFIATAQVLSLAALLYGAYFVLLRGPQLAGTKTSWARVAKDNARATPDSVAERERG